MAVRRGLYVTATAGGVGTTAIDARIDLAGMLTPASDLAAIPGVLSGLAVTGIASGWAYNVAAGHAVTSRSATDGAVLLSVDGVTATPAPVLADGVTAGSTSAPVSGSRWEIIWIRQRDLDNADADNLAVLGVTQGTASGSPTKPTIPAGALSLAEAQVFSGAANTASGSVTITFVAAKVGLRGAPVTVANSTQRDLLNSYASATNPIYVDRLDLGAIERSVAPGVWVQIAGGTVANNTYSSSLGSTLATDLTPTPNPPTSYTTVISFALPSTAPAGRYRVMSRIGMRSSGSPASAQHRIKAAAVVLDESRADVEAALNRFYTLEGYFDHAGGAITLTLDVLCGSSIFIGGSTNTMVRAVRI